MYAVRPALPQEASRARASFAFQNPRTSNGGDPQARVTEAIKPGHPNISTAKGAYTAAATRR
jgi:hypothetical protein